MNKPMTEDELATIEVRAQAATEGPWETRVNYISAGVNDGSHPEWRAPASIPHGSCAFCHHVGTLVRAFTDERGGAIHTHRFAGADEADDWHYIYALDGQKITGAFDYDNGGVCSTEADAEFIAAARQDVPALLAEVRRLRAAEREGCHVEEMTGDYCRWCHPNTPEQSFCAQCLFGEGLSVALVNDECPRCVITGDGRRLRASLSPTPETPEEQIVVKFKNGHR